MRLSVIVPVYNELATIATLLKRVMAVEPDKEVVVVDDGSTDGTGDWLERWAAGQPPSVSLHRHRTNRGKGAAVRTGLAHVGGDCVIIQDGDLEYDPGDYVKLLQPLVEGRSRVVYGSRFLRRRPGMFLSQRLGNVVLTWMTNRLYGTTLTDMETCYKLFAREVLEELTITAERFELEPELTAKVSRQGLEIVEVPISYSGRAYAEGKKIDWRDFLMAVWTLLRHRW